MENSQGQTLCSADLVVRDTLAAALESKPVEDDAGVAAGKSDGGRGQEPSTPEGDPSTPQ